MRPWIGEGAEVWPEGAASWQVYILPEHDEFETQFAELVEAYSPVVRSEQFADCLSPVAWDDLHMTVQPLAGWVADYTEEQVQALRRAVHSRVSDIASFTATAGPAVCTSSGVLLDTDQTGEGQAFTALYERVQAAVVDTFGAEALGRQGWPPHISLAYGTARRDSGEIGSPLRRVRPGRARFPVRALHVCDVRQDPVAHTYTWTRALRVPLAGVPM